MTDFGFEILNYINNADDPVTWVEILNAFSQKKGSILTDDTITRLLDEKLIEKENRSSKKHFNPVPCSALRTEIPAHRSTA